MQRSARNMRRGFKSSIFLFPLLTLMILVQTITGCARKNDLKNLPKANFVVFQLFYSATIVAADQSKQIDTNIDCFSAAGLNPVIIKRSKGPEIVDALIGGSADFGTLANTPLVFQALQGTDIAIFATIHSSDHDIKVIGHKSAGITSGASLRKKRVGYVGGTFGEIFLNRYLAKHGLGRGDISLTSAGPAQLRDLFLSKSLDVIIVWEPLIQDIMSDPAIAKNEIFFDIDRSIYTGRIHLVAKPQTLRQKRKEAESLVKALICGEELTQNNPDKVRKLLEAWLERDPDTLKEVFTPGDFHIELNVPILTKELESEAEWARDAIFSGKTQIPSDFSKYINTSILEAVAPDRLIKR
jgi:NitT/TauT family transport system substrate-binding protein